MRKGAVIVTIVVAGIVGLVFALRPSAEPERTEDNGEVRISNDLYYSNPDVTHVITDSGSGVTYVDNELVIHVNPKTDEEEVVSLAARYGATVVGKSVHTGSYQIRFEKAYDYAEILSFSEELEREELIEDVARNVALELDVESVTGDPAWSDAKKETWGLRAIKAPEAWDLVTADESVRVGIMDDQFFAEHEDLDGVFDEMMPSYELGFNASGNLDTHAQGKHGTHVAGIIGAISNDKGSVGIAHGCTLYGWSAINNRVDKTGNEKATLSYGFEVG